jgi:hypothetical protein
MMIPTPLQPYYKMRVNVRPIKHAYFVREDDIDTIESVIRICCTQWGGLRNLIIPIKPDFTTDFLFEYLLKLHEPDQFVDFYFTADEAQHNLHEELRSYLLSLWPHRSIELWSGPSFIHIENSAHALDVLPNNLDSTTPLTIHELFEGQLDFISSLALFGTIYQGQEEDYSERLQLASKQIKLASSEFWSCQYANDAFSSIINLTTYGILPERVINNRENIIFEVILVNSAQSLCLFWDHRATIDSIEFTRDIGRRTFLLPQSLLTSQSSLEALFEFIRNHFSVRGITSNVHVLFSGFTEEDNALLRSVLALLPNIEEAESGRLHINGLFGHNMGTTERDSRVEVIRYRLGLVRYPSSYFEGVDRQASLNVSLQYGTNEIFHSPSSIVTRGGRNVAVDFESNIWNRYPRLSDISHAVKEGSYFTRYGLTFTGNLPGRADYISLNLPTEWKTHELFFQARGYTVRQSQPSRYADGLVQLTGGVSGLDIIATKAAFLLLDALAVKSTKKIAQRLRQELSLPTNLQEEQFVALLVQILGDTDIAPELKGVPKKYSDLCTLPTLRPFSDQLLDRLTALSARQIVLRGYHLRCESCGTTSWYPIQNVRESVTCPGCNTNFPLPIRDNGSEIRWKYTLNSLVNTAIDQDVLPVLLAIYHLTKDKQACCVVPGLELLRENQVVTDFDFIFVSNSEIFAGECKAGSRVSSKDLNIARTASTLGIHHFYFCTIRRFSEETRQSIHQLKMEFENQAISTTIGILEGDVLLGEAIE